MGLWLLCSGSSHCLVSDCWKPPQQRSTQEKFRQFFEDSFSIKSVCRPAVYSFSAGIVKVQHSLYKVYIAKLCHSKRDLLLISYFFLAQPSLLSLIYFPRILHLPHFYTNDQLGTFLPSISGQILGSPCSSLKSTRVHDIKKDARKQGKQHHRWVAGRKLWSFRNVFKHLQTNYQLRSATLFLMAETKAQDWQDAHPFILKVKQDQKGKALCRRQTIS